MLWVLSPVLGSLDYGFCALRLHSDFWTLGSGFSALGSELIAALLDCLLAGLRVCLIARVLAGVLTGVRVCVRAWWVG